MILSISLKKLCSGLNLIRNVVKLLNSDTAIGGIQLNYNRSELAPLGKSKMEEILSLIYIFEQYLIIENNEDI
jgi:hypothetical protein